MRQPKHKYIVHARGREQQQGLGRTLAGREETFAFTLQQQGSGKTLARQTITSSWIIRWWQQLVEGGEPEARTLG